MNRSTTWLEPLLTRSPMNTFGTVQEVGRAEPLNGQVVVDEVGLTSMSELYHAARLGTFRL